MKLCVNKNHLYGNFRKQRNSLIVRVGATVALFAYYTALSSPLLNYFDHFEKVAMVSEDVRESMYEDNSYFSEKYQLEETPLLKDGKDLYITDKALQSMEKLDIDALKNDDFSFVQMCFKLKDLTIWNAENLSDEALLQISQNKNIRLNLCYNATSFRKNMICPQNLSCLNGMRIHIYGIVDEAYDKELDAYYMYLYFRNVDSSWIEMYAYDKMMQIDQKIESFLTKIDFSDAKNETDILLKLILFVGKYIHYDDIVLQKLLQDPNLEKDSVEEQLAIAYNEETLSFILRNDDEETKGLCCNYAALLSAMCYKMGIESYYVIGINQKLGTYHAWNLAFVDNQWYSIDVTTLDNKGVIARFLSQEQLYASAYKMWKQYYGEDCEMGSSFEIVRTEFKEDALIDAVEPSNNYSVISDVASYKYPFLPSIDVSYINEDINGKLVNHMKPSFNFVHVSFLGGTIASVSLGNQMLEKPNYRVLKKKTVEDE